jgi:hypothetical protein
VQIACSILLARSLVVSSLPRTSQFRFTFPYRGDYAANLPVAGVTSRRMSDNSTRALHTSLRIGRRVIYFELERVGTVRIACSILLARSLVVSSLPRTSPFRITFPYRGDYAANPPVAGVTSRRMSDNSTRALRTSLRIGRRVIYFELERVGTVRIACSILLARSLVVSSLPRTSPFRITQT